ncbi:hypothetical protein [Mangrovimonas cancribranchiae]|uniref:Uncharacterized protein n=1 Tax=Mangrovimonas cancribranchiae TaxID=3080055 RepID=A0AAU6P2L6_9FLAO
MKPLTITLLAVIFCVALTGLNSEKNIKPEGVNHKEVKTNDFKYDFAVNKHVRKKRIPQHG